MRIKTFLQLFKKTFKQWGSRDPYRQSAVIAYFAIFSIPFLLAIIIYAAGIVFGEDAVRGRVANSLASLTGANTAIQIQDMIVQAVLIKHSVVATILGLITLIIGAIQIFIELQKSFNRIWDVQPKEKQGFVKALRDRLLSFGLILSIGFLLAVSLVITSLLTALSGWIAGHFSVMAVYILHAIDLVFSITLISFLFTLMFKVLPDYETRWKYTWQGGLLTALLFIAGKYILSFYFSYFHPASIYGAAGSVVLFLLWVSYTCLIVLYGAEFTRQYTLARLQTRSA